jgi:glycosyltransferase involved in cell wall biosynthesis
MWLREEFGKAAVYLPNALDETVIHQTPPLAPKTGKVRVLLEGPISVPFKGMHDAFRAVEGLNCEVWCVSSSGKPQPGWKCDRFFERVPWASMKRIYSSCDILLKMSRVESFCLPALEMMACGGAVVVGQVTGIEEYAVDQVNALIVPQGDVQAAHDALQRLIEDQHLRNQLIENGMKTAQQWRWDKTIDVLEGVIYAGDPSSSLSRREDAGLDESRKAAAGSAARVGGPMELPPQSDGEEKRRAA